MTGRIEVLMNNDWKFIHGDFPEAEACGYEDGQWYDIGLPHSFGIPYFMENEFYVGYGCYRKWITIKEEWLEKKVYLEFQGVFQEAEIYVNGNPAGGHKGGYTAFLIELSPFLHAGENLIFVRVNNLWNPRLAPRGGEHVFNGGIYRDVSLLVTEPVQIAWYGTFVTTPEVSREKAEVTVRTQICNHSDREVSCTLDSQICYGEKEKVRYRTEEILLPGETRIVIQGGEIIKPELWHPDTPRLYTLKSTLLTEEGKADSCETDFGIRWFSFTADQGFFLNGEHYDIHGANVHQDHAGWSDAVTHTGIQRDIALVKGCGMNFIRGSHYPHHTYFAGECDRQGILFWSENCFWGTGGPKEEGYWTASAYPVNQEDEEEFEESCLRTLEEMIRTNRNHPSIIVWSMCNEPFFSGAEVMHKAKELLRKLVDLSHRLDPTRPAAVGGVQRGGFDAIGDLAGYNGDGAAIFTDPGFPNFVSEYGSIVEDRPGTFGPRYSDGVEKNPQWRSGKAVWCAFHHGSILSDMGHMGIVDYYRLPLKSWYWYRERLLGIPAPEAVAGGIPCRIHLAADRQEMRGDGTQDVQLLVSVVDNKGKRVSNAPDVTLEITQGEGMLPTGKSFVFSGKKGNFAEGLGAVELHCWHRGDIHIRAGASGLEEACLRIRVTGGSVRGEKRLKNLLPPPCVMGAPKRERMWDIAVNRPVFSSSAAPEHPGRNVVDGTWSSWWHPARETAGEWIQVDLEGTKEIRRLRLSFTELVRESYEIALSDDGLSYRELYLSGEGDVNSFLELTVHDEKARYVRLCFRGRPSGVNKFEILV
ncbi:MAG: beta-galactosidase [Lachnospiraceae bacterium]|nr:beta-galactosidase [Lachnospiraceae bacterium]